METRFAVQFVGARLLDEETWELRVNVHVPPLLGAGRSVSPAAPLDHTVAALMENHFFHGWVIVVENAYRA